MPQAIFNIDEINQLLHAVNNSNVNKLKLEKGDFKITIKQGGSTQVVMPALSANPPVAAPAPVVAAPIPAAAPTPPPATAPEASSENYITIKSPMIGTFYRASGPDKPTFVNVGDEIKVGTVLCIIEAMKLFNEIESEMNGTIIKVLVDDTSPVEYDQPLFLVQPK
ncbi:MAG: acetyl-CoA carboxylase, biotin carboxyl carrier protein [Bacteroidetes bacterium OLB11]|nr:MAG: acetyl-CoA carboxylase, biotin carboxyl carrier protein [Bacteroidetes bacterium OLB11]